MRVLVCGARNYSDWVRLEEVLEQIDLEVPFSWVIQGEADGADIMAKEWAMRSGIRVECYPADWERYGRAAGPIRNKQMLVEGKPDLVVAFFNTPYEESKGTRNMVEQAHRAGVPVYIVGVCELCSAGICSKHQPFTQAILRNWRQEALVNEARAL